MNKARSTLPENIEAFANETEALLKNAVLSDETWRFESARLVAIVREQGAVIERLKSYEGERMRHEGFYTAEIARVVGERDAMRERLAKLEYSIRSFTSEEGHSVAEALFDNLDPVDREQWIEAIEEHRHGVEGLRALLNEKGGAA